MEYRHSTQRPYQIKLRSLFLITAAVAIFFGYVVAVRNKWAASGEHGPIADRSQWDEALKEILADASAAQIQVEPVRVCLSRVDWTEHYYVWQMRASPALVTMITQKWRLGPATARDIALLSNDMPHGWAARNTTSSRRYFAAPHGKSENYVVIVDDTADLVYVRYWFNF